MEMTYGKPPTPASAASDRVYLSEEHGEIRPEHGQILVEAVKDASRKIVVPGAAEAQPGTRFIVRAMGSEEFAGPGVMIPVKFRVGDTVILAGDARTVKLSSTPLLFLAKMAYVMASTPAKD